ncbi:MAG: hypothetical protein ACTS5V_08325 [Giesbergeria sp.]
MPVLSRPSFSYRVRRCSVSTLQAMRRQGAGDLVTLTDCRATPAGHIPCVPPFVAFMLGRVGTLARGL